MFGFYGWGSVLTPGRLEGEWSDWGGEGSGGFVKMLSFLSKCVGHLHYSFIE